MKLSHGLFKPTECKGVVQVDDRVYERWGVGCGNKGYVFPIYLGENSISHTIKPCITIDDKPEYTICVYADNNFEHELVTLLSICELYMLRSYHAGKVFKGKVISNTITKDKAILEKIAYLNLNSY